MKKIFFLFIILFTILNVNGQDGKSRLWHRVPKYQVNNAIEDFLDNHDMNNCFYFVENEKELRFKCLRDNKLVEMLLKINDNPKKDFYLAVTMGGIWI